MEVVYNMKLEILLKPQQLTSEIKALQIERDTLRSYAENSTSVLSLAPGHGQGVNRSFENVMTKVADLDTLIERKKKELEETNDLIINETSKLSNSTHRTIIRMRHVMLKSWDEIAATIGYEVRYCQKIANNARKLLATI